jgi:DNA invertase Pin-like site-specific DNA recombinase
MRVIAYTRVSTDEQVNGTSLDEQVRITTGIAMTNGLTVTEVVSDPGISGSIPLLERPGGRQLAELAAGDVVILARLDRGFRSALDALRTVEEWERIGVRLIINGHGEVTDQKNPTGRLMLEMMAVFAGHERRMIRERMAEGRAAKRSKGGHVGGTRPFGFTVDGVGKDARLIPIPEEQAALATARELHAAGFSLRKIAAELAARHDVRVSHVAVAAALRRTAA